MIRINLLAVERGVAKRTTLVPAAHRITIGAVLILLAAALGVGWWFWSLQQTSKEVDQQIVQAEAETQQLRSVLSQVQKFEAQKAQLQQRVTLIEQLRRGQTGPVHVIDEISKAVPDRLWLTEMIQKGQEVTLVGVTTSMSGVSDFLANLEGSAWIKKPVDIIDSEMSSDPKTGDLVKFSVKATINNPEAPAPPAPAGPVAKK
jgi:type IV pilus assembly protein PilN